MRKRMVAVSLIGLLCLGLGAFAVYTLSVDVTASHRIRPASERFILIVADALRADHLGCYGYGEHLTPNLDALAGRSWRFANAIAAGPETLISNRALLTGLYPYRTRDPAMRGLRDGTMTLAAQFKAAGYATAAFSAHPSISPQFGFGEGFDEFSVKALADDRVTNDCAEWLTKHRGQRYFVLLYLLDPHSPYDPKQIDARVRGLLENPEVRPFIRRGEVGWGDRRPHITSDPTGPHEFTQAEITALHGLYEADIRDMDARVGRILRAIGHDDRAAVAFLADHGQAWLEHGFLGHGASFHREVLHIPFILHLPERAPRVVEEFVSNTDVAPTLLALAGIKPKVHFDGQCLVDTPIASDRVVLAEGHAKCAAYSAAESLLYRAFYLNEQSSNLRAESWERYDTTVDPEQRTRLETPESDPLKQVLRDHEQLVWDACLEKPVGTPRELDEKVQEQLRALGYFE